MPDGFTLDEAAGTSLLDILNNQGMSAADRANALISLQASLTTKSSEAGSQAWNDEQAAWQAEVAADPVLGGANLPATIAGIGNLMNRFATPEARAAFDKSGAGNNPHIVRFLSTLVGQLKEPAPLDPGNPGNGGVRKTPADRMFG